jgi:hypothetical protein
LYERKGTLFIDAHRSRARGGPLLTPELGKQLSTENSASQVAQTLLRAVKDGSDAPRGEDLLVLFSQLEPVSIDSLIGLWRVAAFGQPPRDRVANQPGPGPLPQREGLGVRKLYGKRFLTRDDAEPVVCRDDDGSLVASIDFGVARLRELSFRGTASAGMVYDQQPWIDYFRRLDDDTLVALIDIKGQAMGIGFFLLRD